MDHPKLFPVLGVIGLSLFFAGCVNLGRVNDYAANAAGSIGQFEELGYSFNKACQEKCQMEQLEKQQLLTKGCDCQTEKEADSVTLVIYHALKGYFEGLAKLSGNELTNYRFNALTNGLTAGNFGLVHINQAQVNACTKVSNILTQAITNGYRRKKLTTYIGEANESVKILLDALKSNLVTNLTRRLETQRQRTQSYYFDLSKDNAISPYEKKKVIEEYNGLMAGIDVKKRQIAVFGKGIESIGAGHQELYDARSQLKTKEIKELLTRYGSEIQDTVDEFNKLKNEN